MNTSHVLYEPIEGVERMEYYRPPETYFEITKPLTFSSDIWTLACTIWEIIAQRSLFEGFFTDEDDMTRQQIDMLGPLPNEWL